jgi:hypothetical protein
MLFHSFPEIKEFRVGIRPNCHIHASVSDLYIPTIGLLILLEEICIAHRHMNVEIPSFAVVERDISPAAR